MTVREWLNSNQDFNTGVAIYCSHPNASPILIRSFSRRHTKLLAQKLAYEMRKIDQKKVKPKNNKSEGKKGLAFAKAEQNLHIQYTAPKVPTTILMHDLPEPLRPVLERANNLFKEICRLKISLNELPKRSTRKAYVIQEKIYHNFLDNAACWREIDYWKEYGDLAPKQKSKLEKLTPDERAVRMNTVRVRITRIQNRVDQYSTRLAASSSLKEINRQSALRKKAKKALVQAKLEQAELIKLRKSNDHNYQSS